MNSPNPLADVALGDILTLPDGRCLTARARVTLPVPSGSMAGFVILGEMEALVSVPVYTGHSILVYDPISSIPVAANTARVVAEGAANYWAPHLPAVQAAMGEVLYRVVEVRGSIHPLVFVYRGQELIVFVMSQAIDPLQVDRLAMPQGDTSDVLVSRHAALVTSPHPVSVPDFVEAPVRVSFSRPS